MTNFNYFKISKTQKIRYMKHIQNNTIYIVFLHGFMSDLQGAKPKAFLSFAKRNKYEYVIGTMPEFYSIMKKNKCLRLCS